MLCTTETLALHHHLSHFLPFSKCVAVLCCRLSPIQKASVVKLVKNGPIDAENQAKREKFAYKIHVELISCFVPLIFVLYLFL